jgi:hypothetical protein
MIKITSPRCEGEQDIIEFETFMKFVPYHLKSGDTFTVDVDTNIELTDGGISKIIPIKGYKKFKIDRDFSCNFVKITMIKNKKLKIEIK